MSARFRRTNQMIDIDDKRVSAGLSAVPWADYTDLGREVALSVLSADATATLPVTDAPKATETAPQAAPAPAAPPATNGVQYTAVAEEAPPVVGNGASQAEIIDLVTKTTAGIIGASMSQFEARLNAVAASVRPRQVIAGIKINENPVAHMPDGAHPTLPELIRKMNALRAISRSVLLVGPGGSGKTLLGRQLAEALKVPLTIIPLSQGVSEAHLHGRFTPDGWKNGVFSEAYSKPGVIVLDEFDAGDRNAVLSLNAPLSAPGYTNPLNGQWVGRHADCWILATANTTGRGSDGVYSARDRLDAATLDRFLLEPVGYLETVEDTLLTDARLRSDLRTLRIVIEDNGGSEFIGYRAFQTAQVLKDAGYTRDQILGMLIFPFAPDLKDAAVKKLQIKGAA